MAKNEIEVAKPSTAEILIGQALEKGLPVETIERLLAMRTALKLEAAKEAFDEAMSNFQGECPVIEKKKEAKDERNGRILYKYAQIESIVEQVRPLLQKHGLSYTFNVIQDKETLTVTCTVTHKAGHSQAGQFQVPSTGGTQIMSGPQKYAAALTFAKRYTFCNALGIMTGDEDTDAPKTKADDLATEKQLETIADLAKEAGYTPEKVASKFKEKYGTAFDTMSKTQAEGVIKGLQTTVGEKFKKEQLLGEVEAFV